jgi:hypothetical protein
MENIVMVLQEIEPVNRRKKPKSLCIHDGCDKYSLYNVVGESRPQYCNGHKQPEMVNVKDKKCEHEGCNKRPNFNNPDETTGRLCNSHKEPEMVNVKDKKCEHEGCNKQPKFNNPDETTGILCNSHKEPEMVNVVNKKCEHECCNKQPVFNYIGKKTGRLCNSHKEPEMVNVVSKTCEYDGCNKQPTFNYIGKKGGSSCVKHKQPGMVDVKNKTCLHDWCDTIVSNKKYEGFCLRCFIYKYPLKTVSKNYKTKEFAVVEFIRAKFPEHIWIADKIVTGGFSRRRPDLILYLKDYIIIIEIDENQHIDYECLCENRRIMEISQDLGHKNAIFIRFNPDDYKSGDKKITSCWAANGNGICAVKKSKTTEWNDRLNVLKAQVNYWIDNKSDRMIQPIHLFYDEN